MITANNEAIDAAFMALSKYGGMLTNIHGEELGIGPGRTALGLMIEAAAVHLTDAGQPAFHAGHPPIGNEPLTALNLEWMQEQFDSLGMSLDRLTSLFVDSRGEIEDRATPSSFPAHWDAGERQRERMHREELARTAGEARERGQFHAGWRAGELAERAAWEDRITQGGTPGVQVLGDPDAPQDQADPPPHTASQIERLV